MDTYTAESSHDKLCKSSHNKLGKLCMTGDRSVHPGQTNRKAELI